MGYFPESYVEVGSTASALSQSPTVSTPSSSYTDGPLAGLPPSVSSVGQFTSASTKYGN